MKFYLSFEYRSSTRPCKPTNTGGTTKIIRIDRALIGANERTCNSVV